MFNCISLYVIGLYWRIYVCMYHLEYMYIVSAYKYMLALAYLQYVCIILNICICISVSFEAKKKFILRFASKRK